MLHNLENISKSVRRYILESTTEAGSGHLTSSLSAVELMVTLLFGGFFRYRTSEPEYMNNDRLIFSKGHAAPLLYSLWSVAGVLDKQELLTLRKFESRLEGHPTRRFPYTEVATGSLGQGLSVGIGMALAARMDSLPYTTYVLLGDSELAEGQNWEAMQLASYYRLSNLVGIVDMNRLGQRGETMYGWDTENLKQKCEAFGWRTFVADGHNLEEIAMVYGQLEESNESPTMIIGKTVKGKGIARLENKEDWHGKVLTKEEMGGALREIGETEEGMMGTIAEPMGVSKPEEILRLSGGTNSARSTQDDTVVFNSLTTVSSVSAVSNKAKELDEIDQPEDYKKPLATRKAYGHALVEMYPKYPEMVVLDAEVSNSTYARDFKEKYPRRFFEMFIAEQNMVSVAVGMALRGKLPFVSTFASFFSRAFDQIRVAQYSQSGVNFVGSHVGVSIGEDGPTQMGLEDIALFRAILDSVVLYPADHVAQEKLAIQMAEHRGICYMRTTRMDTAPLYGQQEEFVIGGSKTLRTSERDLVTLIGAGVTLYEALQAYDDLAQKGIQCRVIDLYSIKPVDVETLVRACKETRALVVIEDHFAEGGMAEAVRSNLIYESTPVHSLAVRKMPKSGRPEELMSYEEIDKRAIVRKVEEILL